MISSMCRVLAPTVFGTNSSNRDYICARYCLISLEILAFIIGILVGRIIDVYILAPSPYLVGFRLHFINFDVVFV